MQCRALGFIEREAFGRNRRVGVARERRAECRVVQVTLDQIGNGIQAHIGTFSFSRPGDQPLCKAWRAWARRRARSVKTSPIRRNAAIPPRVNANTRPISGPYSGGTTRVTQPCAVKW